MRPVTKSNEHTARDRMIDMRRPGIVKGAIVPVSRRPIDNMVVAPTSG